VDLHAAIRDRGAEAEAAARSGGGAEPVVKGTRTLRRTRDDAA
jgi:hypothetical protein